MNLLDNYSKILVTNNNINKHNNIENNKEDNNHRKLGEKNPIGPKDNEDLLYYIENNNVNNIKFWKNSYDRDSHIFIYLLNYYFIFEVAKIKNYFF